MRRSRSVLLPFLLLPALAGAAPADEVVRVAEALAVRHDPPACEVLVEGLSDPGAVLVAVTEQVPSPPWVAVRAARCAARLPEARPALVRWVNRTDAPGLAEVVVLELRGSSLPHAREVLDAALAGPHRTRVLEALGWTP